MEKVNNISIVGTKCTGCGTCGLVCHKKCIDMSPDEEGFLYPRVSNDCINCGLCKKACPQCAPILEKVENQTAYIALTDLN